MKLSFTIALSLLLGSSFAQELFIYTEPASNMSARSIGLRLNNFVMPMTYGNRTAYRIDPEIMWGVNKHLMLHANAYASNMMQRKFRFEGGSVYAKYRFLSRDDIHKHFRMAAFGKVAVIDNPYSETHVEKHQLSDGNGGYIEHDLLVSHSSDEQNLDGNQSGWQAGLIATQLINKFAVSGSVSSISRWDNLNGNFYKGPANGALQSTLSTGYLLFPRKYEHYNQTNMNLYAELISQRLYNNPEYFLDAGTGIQFIFNSICRLDLGYRFQVAGTMNRFNTRQWLVRFEYNWLNVFSRNKS
ncbi:MAG: hypothetical protein V4717_21585 [Bacteroidota bacterium]